MDPRDKQEQRERYLRMAAKHFRTHAEEQALRAHSKARKAGRRSGKRAAAEDWDEDDAGFEPIRKAERATLGRRAAPDLGPSPLDLPADARRARVLAVHRGRLDLSLLEGARETLGVPPPAQGSAVVGDELWITGEGARARVCPRRPRRTRLARADAAGGEDLIAANVDLGLIVVALREPGVRPGLVQRVALALAAGGVQALVVVNKLDLLPAAGRQGLADEARAWELGPLELLFVSAGTGEGLDDLRARIAGRACVLVGHSGVGKSSLVNALHPDATLATRTGRSYDGKGRHTTSASSTWEWPDGTLLIDTPGVRAFATTPLARAELDGLFPDVAELARACRFSDCAHDSERGCAVRDALARGVLAPARWQRYRDLGDGQV